MHPDARQPEDTGRLGGAACGGIDYPVKGFYGDNILAPTLDQVGYAPTGTIELAARLAATASLRLKLTHVMGARWSAQPGGDYRTMEVSSDPHVQLLEAKFSGQMNETTMLFFGGGRLLIEYFECGATEPSGSKILYWGNGSNEGGVP
jgi:hypothetical protein